MAQTSALVDKLLTNVSSAYIPVGYISEQLLPTVNVAQYTGKLGKYGSSHLRIETTLMSGEGQARRVNTIVRSSTTYAVEDHGLEGIVTPADRVNVEKPYDAEKDEVIGLSTALWLGKEKGLADSLTDTGVITQNTTLSGTSQFSDYTNSDPLTKFVDAHNAVYDGCGLPPDTAVMSWKVYNTLAYHPGILDALGFTKQKSGPLKEADLMRAMQVKRLLIGGAMYESATEGQSSSLASVWGKHIVFCVAPMKAAPYQVSLGYHLRLSGRSPRQVFKYAINNPPESTGIVVRDSYDQLLSNVSAAYLIKNAIA